MSEDHDNKTEEATDKKLSDARAEGNVPVSRELPVAFALIGIVLATIVTAESAMRASAEVLARLLDHVGDIRLASLSHATALHWAILWSVGSALLPSFALLLLCGLGGGVLQRPLSLTPSRLAPDVSRISPVAGWARLFGFSGLIEFGKSLAKLLIVSAIAALIVRRQMVHALDPMAMELGQLLPGLRVLMIPLLAGITAGVALIAGFDVIWARRRWLAGLRMTKQEVKDETRESQGDPMVKGRMRSMARQRARSRMMAAVPSASFIVANPTHFAVALRYVRGEGEAPKVLAKGRDLMALRIREIAEAHAIPVIENKPLARALHDVARVDSIIPQEFYRPVAEIVNYLNRSGSGRIDAQPLRQSLRRR